MGNETGDVGTRSRKRRNVIGNSPNRDEYVRLMSAGWSSYSLEKYAWHRYGEDIPDRTFRLYKSKHQIKAPADPLKEISLDDIPDVTMERVRILQLQKGRIGIDVAHETAMNKLFGTTGREIELYSKLLTELRSDLQEVGLLPRPGQENRIPEAAKDNSPSARSLGEVFGTDDTAEAELAKVLHMHLPMAPTAEAN